MESLKRPNHRRRGFAPERAFGLVLLVGVMAAGLEEHLDRRSGESLILGNGNDRTRQSPVVEGANPGMEALAARWPLSINATPKTFHWEPGYACCFSKTGPAATLGNLSLHLVPGLYDGELERAATVAVYDALPDRARVFLASGYQFEARLCGTSFFILNWTGTMGDEELTLIELKLERSSDRWRIETIILTRYSTRRHSSLDGLAPCGGRERE